MNVIHLSQSIVSQTDRRQVRQESVFEVELLHDGFVDGSVVLLDAVAMESLVTLVLTAVHARAKLRAE